MCWKCGKIIETKKIYSRSDECPSCGTDVRCCRNCKFFSPGSQYDCHEHISESVFDKEKANFCDAFTLRDQSALSNSSADQKTAKAADAKKAFDSLFG